MGKYEDNLPTRMSIISGLETIKRAIDRSDVAEEDKRIIVDTYLKMAQQWCISQATFMAYDALLKEDFREAWTEMMNSFIHSQIYNQTFLKKMEEDWPY